MAKLKETPSQTAGPYVHIGCMPSVAGLAGMYGGTDPGAQMILGDTDGPRMTLRLKIIDGAGDPLTDAMIEIWQPGPQGSFGPTQGFNHWGRQPTDPQTGEVVFDTLLPDTPDTPGKPDAPDTPSTPSTQDAPDGQAPHVLIWIMARGINLALTTRMYFPDQRNEADRVFALAGARASTMLAQPIAGGFSHVIHLQGDAETVFFDV